MTDDRSAFTEAREFGKARHHEQRLARVAEDAVFEALLDDWDYGNCPGSKLKVGNQEVWIYTREDVRQWIRDAQRARKVACDD